MFDEIECIMNQKEHHSVKLWLIIVLLLMIILYISLFHEYKMFKTYQATVIHQNNKYYLNLYLTDQQLIKFNYKKMYIDNKIVNKKIISISNEYILTEMGKFRLVTLDANINKDDKINNNLIEIKIHERNTTIMKELIDKLVKGGIYEGT